MLNSKLQNPAPAVLKQRDVDICAALMGAPLGETTPNDIHAEPQSLADVAPIELSQLFVMPKNKEAVRQYVKQVQSRVVQVSGVVKDKVVVASGQVRGRMAIINEQVKQRMAESAAQTAKRMKKAS